MEDLYSELRRLEASFVSSRQKIVWCLWGNGSDQVRYWRWVTLLGPWKVIFNLLLSASSPPSGLWVSGTRTLIPCQCRHWLLWGSTNRGIRENQPRRAEGRRDLLLPVYFWQNHLNRVSLPRCAVHSSFNLSPPHAHLGCSFLRGLGPRSVLWAPGPSPRMVQALKV